MTSGRTMAIATDISGLVDLQFYDLPDSSTLHLYWRASVARSVAKRGQYRVKRAVDLLLAAMLLISASPLMLLAAALIRLTSRGPVFYRQQRLGRDGQEFTLLKFRTMVDGADAMLDKVFHLNEANGPIFKSRRDPRITRIGRLLRATFIDELPQLMNVLQGDMSLVGPRPILAQEIAALPGRVAFRFAVPQGITGPWQTNGHHKLSFDQQLEVERQYIVNWTVWIDLQILLKTVPLVARWRGW